MDDEEILSFFKDYAVIGDSHADSLAGHGFFTAPIHRVYTFYSFYTSNTYERTKESIGENKNLMVLVGGNDVLLDGEVPLAVSFPKFLLCLLSLKEALKLENVIAICPASFSKDIEIQRSAYPTPVLRQRLDELEILIQEYAPLVRNSLKLLPSSHIATTNEGFIQPALAHPDGIHFTQSGYRVWAQELIKTIKEIENG